MQRPAANDNSAKSSLELHTLLENGDVDHSAADQFTGNKMKVKSIDRNTWRKSVIYGAILLCSLIVWHVFRSREFSLQLALPWNKERPLLLDNLLPEKKYIISFPLSGLSNQILCAARLLELAEATKRIPILARLDPRFHPLDIPAGYEPLSTFFKLPRNALDLAQHKDYTSEGLDHLSCWDFHVIAPESYFQWGTPGFLVDKIPLPSRAELSPTFSNIARFASSLPEYALWKKRLQWLFPEQLKDLAPIPTFDPNLLAICHTFDFPVSVGLTEGSRSDNPDLYPSMLARLHFSDEVNQLRIKLLQHLSGGTSPPKDYISMHMRRGDFCIDRVDCTPSVYVKRFEEGLSNLLSDPACSVTSATPIIVSVEETDPQFLSMLQRRNWLIVDHATFGTTTQQRRSDGSLLDGWWPPILDQAVIAGAHAFIGSKTSTFSGISQARVQAWTGGCTALV